MIADSLVMTCLRSLGPNLAPLHADGDIHRQWASNLSSILASLALPGGYPNCLIAASFEYGARKHNIPITTKEWPDKDTRPDLVPFLFGDTLVILEADMGSETIYTEQDATAISEKLVHYLALIKDGSIERHFKVKKFIILFITTRESRRDSMVEVLKKVIDKHYYDDDDFAEHFGFTNIEYDRYINKIPKLTDWAVSQPYQRAGFEAFSFVHGTISNGN